MSPPPDVAAGAAPSGAIHDIGYRRYEGPRLGRGYIARSLVSSSLRSAYGLGRTAKSKVVPFAMLGLMLIPALIMVTVTIVTGASELPIPYMQYAMATQVVVSLFVAAASPQLFSRDLRFSTIGLYLSRPLERFDYVAAKFAALAAAVAILLGAPLVVLYAGALLGELPFGEQTEGFLYGVASAVLFSLLLAGIGAVIASITTRRGLGVAAIIGVLVVSFTAVNVVAGIAREQNNETLAEYAGLFSPVTLIDGLQLWAVGSDSEPASAAIPPTSTGVGLLYALVTLVVIAGSFGLLLLRYRRVSA